MRIQKFYILAGIIFVFWACSEKGKYQPEFEEKWGEVENFVHANWHTSLIDSRCFPQLKEKGIVPPKPYMSIARGEPTLFYWDNYFTNKGLLLIDSLALYALNVVDNLLWEVDTLGFAPNASKNWGMNRSQIPYLAPMVFDVYEKYDVVTGGINDWEYPAWEFLGWSAGVYIWCLEYYRNNN